jgi:uncharacterized membrane protein
MAVQIKNPIEWSVDQFRLAGHAIGESGTFVRGSAEAEPFSPVAVRKIGIADLKDALARGFDDFGACRSDVLLLGLIYPLIGLVLARLIFGYGMLPLLFPLASGFVLIGPAAAVGLYEMSRRREQGLEVSWADSFGVVASPRFGAILLLGLFLLAIFLAWLIVAQAIYALTLGPEPPASLSSFLHDVFSTAEGWLMIVIGMGVGFLFAALVLATSVISVPLLLDRDVGFPGAIVTSVRAVMMNPGPMALWGLLVAGGLAAGALPLFIGLAIVVPVFGHATWHLYRKLVASEPR